VPGAAADAAGTLRRAAGLGVPLPAVAWFARTTKLVIVIEPPVVLAASGTTLVAALVVRATCTGGSRTPAAGCARSGGLSSQALARLHGTRHFGRLHFRRFVAFARVAVRVLVAVRAGSAAHASSAARGCA
jgi:hypothetical protein